MTDSNPELTPERIHELRDQADCLSLSFVLYLDLPEEKAEEWLDQSCTVMALDRKLSENLLVLIDESDSGVAHGIQDEASRALRLFLSLGPDRQALLVGLMEGMMNTRDTGPGKPDPLAGHNAERSNWEQRVNQRGDDEKAASDVLEPADAPLDTDNVVNAAMRILGQGGAA